MTAERRGDIADRYYVYQFQMEGSLHKNSAVDGYGICCQYKRKTPSAKNKVYRENCVDYKRE